MTVLTVLPDKKGFSLVEVMIAMVVLLLVSLALMQTALVSIDSNAQNLLRDEAVNYAEERMTFLRNLDFGNALLNDTGGADVVEVIPVALRTREFRNIDTVYSSTKNIDDLDASNKQVTITVNWTWKGEAFNHTITSIVRDL